MTLTSEIEKLSSLTGIINKLHQVETRPNEFPELAKHSNHEMRELLEPQVVLAELDDWQHTDGSLFVSKYGMDGNKLFVEVSNVQGQAIAFNSRDLPRFLARNVDTLCIRGGGRYVDKDAKIMMLTYLKS